MLPIKRWGNGGEPVVLVHGFLGSADVWGPAAALLGRSFEVIAVDLPGFGSHTAETSPDRIEDFAHAVLDTATRLRLDRFHLIGHSMGGMIAQQAAIDGAGRIAKLVLYGTTDSGALPHRFEPITATIDRMRARGVVAIGQEIARSWFADGVAPAGCLAAVDNVTIESATAALTAIHRWDLRPRLQELNMPCLAICGDRDRSTAPEEMLLLYRRLPRAQWCVLPGCAHAAHLERTDMWVEVVDRFLGAPS
jgi:pimeloyl-ACP methyl ester carboxylesterase